MQKLARIIIQTTLFLVPLFFLPITRDAFDFNKYTLLLIATLILGALWAIQTMQRNRIEVVAGSLDKGVALLGLSYLLSFLLASHNKIVALTQPGGAGTIFTFILFYFFSRQFLFNEKKKALRIVLSPLFLSATVLAALFIIQASGAIGSLSVPAYLKTRIFTPAGSLVILVSFLGTMLLILLQKSLSIYKHGTGKEKTAITIMVPVLAIALIAGFILMSRPEYKPALLPQAAGWAIAIHSFSDPKMAAFGVGPSQYINAFTTGKPAWLNNTEFWRFRSAVSSNWYFQVMTETGILGIVALGFLIYLIIKFPKKHTALFIPLALMLFIPGNFLLLLTVFSLLMVTGLESTTVFGFPADRHHGEKNLLKVAYSDTSEKQIVERSLSRPVTTIASLLVLAGIIGTLYYTQRMYRADVAMRKGIQSAFSSNNQQTYELQRQAIMLNPFDPDYHVIFSQTNMALANLISRQKDLTDEQKKTVTQLVTQSINNGKLAARLFPSAATWENLAGLYTNLLSAVKGADQWTVQLYQQAINLDPVNPVLHVSLGGIYYSLKQYNPAVQEFGSAIRLKGDYANAWYNIANGFREIKNIQASQAAYQNALKLIKPDSNDYKKAKAELDALPAVDTKTSGAKLNELTTPESSPAGKLKKETAPTEEEVSPEAAVEEQPQEETSDSGSLNLESNTTPEPPVNQ